MSSTILLVPTYLILGGSGGIRTHGTFRYDSFQDCCLKPLGHTSLFQSTKYSITQTSINVKHYFTYSTNKKPDLFGIGFVYYSYFGTTYTNPFGPIKPVSSLFGER